MMPIVDGLEERYATRVKFVRLDFDDPAASQQARAFGLYGHPAFGLVKANGQVMARFAGEVAPSNLEAAIEELLAGG